MPQLCVAYSAIACALTDFGYGGEPGAGVLQRWRGGEGGEDALGQKSSGPQARSADRSTGLPVSGECQSSDCTQMNRFCAGMSAAAFAQAIGSLLYIRLILASW